MAAVAADQPIELVPVTTPPLRRGRSRPRSPEVKALTTLLCGAVACLASGTLFPMSDQAPRTPGVAMLVLGLLMAAATWWVLDRLPRWALLVEACLVCALNSLIVTQAHTAGGAMAD